MATFTQVKTADGSTTVFHSLVGEHYHSIHGAETESIHVFLKSGLEPYLDAAQKKVAKVFEVGFGTGLNAFLTAELAQERGWDIEYLALEPHPLPVNLLSPPIEGSLNWMEFRKGWPYISNVRLSDHFNLTVLPYGLENSVDNSSQVDFIYYDAFSPTHQPEMWTTAMLSHLGNWAKPGTVLVTYCIRGHIRRSLHELGWRTKKMPGAPGKREMLWAEKLA